MNIKTNINQIVLHIVVYIINNMKITNNKPLCKVNKLKL